VGGHLEIAEPVDRSVGKVDPGKTTDVTWTMTNTGKETLAVVLVKRSCNCTDTSFAPQAMVRIAPGESKPFKASWHAQYVGTSPQTVTLTFKTSDLSRPEVTLSFKGVVNPRVIAYARASFQYAPPGKETKVVFHLSSVDKDFAVLDAVSSDPDTKVTFRACTPAEIKAITAHIVEIRAAIAASPGNDKKGGFPAERMGEDWVSLVDPDTSPVWEVEAVVPAKASGETRTTVTVTTSLAGLPPFVYGVNVRHANPK
jgi:hypothetical protein